MLGMAAPGNGDPWEWRPVTIYIIYSCQLSSFELIKMTSAKISKVTISNSNYIGLIVIVISVELVSSPGFSWTLVTPLKAGRPIGVNPGVRVSRNPNFRVGGRDQRFSMKYYILSVLFCSVLSPPRFEGRPHPA